MISQRIFAKFATVIEHQRHLPNHDVFSIANIIRRRTEVYAKQPTSIGVYQFAKLAGDLKRVKRAGWMQFEGVKDVESVADHSWRMSLLCMLFSQEKGVDVGKCMKFAIIHDLSEVIVGDITPRDQVNDSDKHKIEDNGIKVILNAIPNDSLRKELYGLWKEYEEKQSIESLLVKDLDRYEMLLQAYEYEQMYKEVDLSEFFLNAKKITHPRIKLWVQELLDLRNQSQQEKSDF